MADLNISFYTTFDKPYPYISTFDKSKNIKPIMIYPAIVENLFLFYHLAKVLTIDKNNIPDKDIIQMSYLEFLIKMSTTDNKFMDMLNYLFAMVLKNDTQKLEYGFIKKKNPIIRINGIIYNHKDFENIRQIICEQNLVDLPNEKIAKPILDSIELAKKLRNSKIKMGGLEDQIIALSVETGIPIQDIYKMTIRKFRKMIERTDHILHYKIYLAASMSGFVEFKDKNIIKHWLTDLQKDPLSELIPYDDFKNKLSGVIS